MATRWVVLASVALGLGGCKALRDRWEAEHVEVETRVCVDIDPTDDSMRVSVTVPGNLDSCTRMVDSGCDVVIEGQRIELDAWADLEHKVAAKGETLGSVSCTHPERPVVIDCDVGSLPPGTYDVHAADDEIATLTIDWPDLEFNPTCFQTPAGVDTD